MALTGQWLASVSRFDVMQLCWDRQPNNRPDFSKLSEFFGSILHNSVKQVCLLLNHHFVNYSPSKAVQAISRSTGRSFKELVSVILLCRPAYWCHWFSTVAADIAFSLCSFTLYLKQGLLCRWVTVVVGAELAVRPTTVYTRRTQLLLPAAGPWAGAGMQCSGSDRVQGWQGTTRRAADTAELSRHCRLRRRVSLTARLRESLTCVEVS